jgi:hypothetical protein
MTNNGNLIASTIPLFALVIYFLTTISIYKKAGRSFALVPADKPRFAKPLQNEV